MAIFSLFSRFKAYLRRYGFAATVRRTGLAVRRTLFSNRAVLFYCDLSGQSLAPVEFPTSLNVERKRSQVELDAQDAQQIIHVWNPRVARQRLEQRFARGASLWLIKFNDRLAGYGWTLRGATMEPHYFPLGPHDAHLFDFHVYPLFRGQGMNPLLVRHILTELAGEGAGRAFIEAAEWNQAQLSSLGKTPFRCLGHARKWTILRCTTVWWSNRARQVDECLCRERFAIAGRQ
jgi:ribosomal protein S18 acetylase RimI-like enzyme